MPRISDVLERESRNVDLEPGDYERLLGRRERKERNRRIRAGAVGVIVALATGIVLVRSLTSEPVPADPAVEPQPAPAVPGTLAYALDGDIYVADPDGSNAVKIADGLSAEDCYGWGGEYWAEGSMWSPDGRYLAFRRYTDCSSEEETPLPRDVVISDAQGNVVAMFPAQGWQIAWSPDSTRVAVWDDYFETTFTVGVYGLDGARQTQLTMPPGWSPSGDHDPVWRQDGESLLVNDVVVPIDGSMPYDLRLPDPYEFSPDGSRVAYTTRRSLVIAEADFSNPQEVFGEWAGDLTWSAGGDRIAFISSRPGNPTPNQLHILDVATGSVTLLVEADGSDTGIEVFLSVIDFSPEGDRILFSRMEAINDDPSDPGSYRFQGVGSLWSVNADGSDLRRLVPGTTWGDWWSPSQTP